MFLTILWMASEGRAALMPAIGGNAFLAAVDRVLGPPGRGETFDVPAERVPTAALNGASVSGELSRMDEPNPKAEAMREFRRAA